MARSSPTSPATRPLKAIGAAPTPMPAPCSPAGTSPVTPGMSLEHGLPPAVVLSMLSDNEANPAPRAPSIMGALAEFERSLIIERVTAGIPAAKKTRQACRSAAEALARAIRHRCNQVRQRAPQAVKFQTIRTSTLAMRESAASRPSGVLTGRVSAGSPARDCDGPGCLDSFRGGTS